MPTFCRTACTLWRIFLTQRFNSSFTPTPRPPVLRRPDGIILTDVSDNWGSYPDPFFQWTDYKPSNTRTNRNIKILPGSISVVGTSFKTNTISFYHNDKPICLKEVQPRTETSSIYLNSQCSTETGTKPLQNRQQLTLQHPRAVPLRHVWLQKQTDNCASGLFVTSKCNFRTVPSPAGGLRRRSAESTWRWHSTWRLKRNE
jgi:hypothetical protein